MPNRECFYVPAHLVSQVIAQIPDVIGIDFSRSVDEQLYRVAHRLPDTDPRTILPEDMPPDEARQWHERVVSAHRRLQVTLATREASWPLWLLNSLHNLSAIQARGQSIATASWPLRSRPAVILGNGFSLSESLARLKPYRDHYTLFAVWHALPTVLESNLIPDAVVHIDKHKPGFHSEGSLPGTIPLIASPTAHAGFLESFPHNPVYLLLSGESEAHHQWAEFLGWPMQGSAFGTVSAAAIRAAMTLGHTDIILAGIDLAFQTAEAARNYGDLGDRGVVEAVSPLGTQCFTIQSFLVYRDVLERMAAQESATARFYSVPRAGIRLEGFAPYTFA